MKVNLKSNSTDAQNPGDYFIIHASNPDDNILILKCPFCGYRQYLERNEYIKDYSSIYPKFKLTVLGKISNTYIKCCKNYRIIKDEVTEVK